MEIKRIQRDEIPAGYGARAPWRIVFEEMDFDEALFVESSNEKEIDRFQSNVNSTFRRARREMSFISHTKKFKHENGQWRLYFWKEPREKRTREWHDGTPEVQEDK